MALAIALAPGLVRAQSARDDADSSGESPYRFRTLFRDIGLYATAPIRWDSTDWMFFGGAIAAVAASHGLDTTVRKHFTAGQNIPLDGKDPHSTTDALPAALVVGGTFFWAWNIDDDSGRGETWSMLEAAGLGTATAYVGKFAAGRDRPNQTSDPNEWRKGGSSFPSVHVTAATAIGAILAESGSDDYRWVRRILGYGVAGGTMYLRLKHNEHWFSDTVAGAVLGGSSARFVYNRTHPTDYSSGFRLDPIPGGAMLSYSAPLH
jgi:undecaprenyl-diphosphatase